VTVEKKVAGKKPGYIGGGYARDMVTLPKKKKKDLYTGGKPSRKKVTCTRGTVHVLEGDTTNGVSGGWDAHMIGGHGMKGNCQKLQGGTRISLHK